MVQYIISEGPSGTGEDLHMTYVFELFRPQIEKGCEADRQLLAQYEKTSKMAVDSMIAIVRKMVTAGKFVS